jgi:hypothetical protein
MQIRFKKSITQILLFTGLIIGLASCKKDKDDAPNNPPITERIKEYKEGDEFIRFDYNVAGEVTKVTVNTDLNTGGTELAYTVTYNAAKKLAKLQAASGEQIIPIYENNKLTRADIMMGNDRIGYTNYTYEADQLKRATIYFGSGTDFEPFLEFLFTHDAAGNVSQTIAMVTNGVPGQLVRSGHVNLQYDQKTNPLYAQRDILILFWHAVSKNNIKGEDHFDATLQLEDKFAYNYTYNSKGLPTGAVVTQGLPGQPPVVTNLQYSYQQ